MNIKTITTLDKQYTFEGTRTQLYVFFYDLFIKKTHTEQNAKCTENEKNLLYKKRYLIQFKITSHVEKKQQTTAEYIQYY